jgi:hypothetical protein
MKYAQTYIWMVLLVFGINGAVLANEPDSVYLVSYATLHDKGRSGLRFAWSVNGQHWNLVGNGNPYVKCNFGSRKYINSPYLFQDVSGVWHCLWSLNDTVNQFAHVASTDLVTWGRQAFPYLKEKQQFRQPVVQYDKSSRQYTIAFLSGNQYFKITTSDFKIFDEAIAITANEYKDDRVTLNLPGAATITGNLCKVAWPVVAKLTDAWQIKQYKDKQTKESFLQDSLRFAGLKPLTATITLQQENRKPISDLLIGVFFGTLTMRPMAACMRNCCRIVILNTSPAKNCTATAAGTAATPGQSANNTSALPLTAQRRCMPTTRTMQYSTPKNPVAL